MCESSSDLQFSFPEISDDENSVKDKPYEDRYLPPVTAVCIMMVHFLYCIIVEDMNGMLIVRCSSRGKIWGIMAKVGESRRRRRRVASAEGGRIDAPNGERRRHRVGRVWEGLSPP